MPRVIKNVQGKNLIEFDNGHFDEWCVFLTRPGTARYAPRDTEYFTILKNMGRLYGHAKIYNDFISYYNNTSTEIDNNILDQITELSKDYAPHSEEMDIWFTVLYAGMIAEENKANAVLKKRIKRLGMHQVLLNNMAPEEAADFSKGKRWMELDRIMREKGF